RLNVVERHIAADDRYGSVTTISDKQSICCCVITDTLRVLQTRNNFYNLVSIEIDDANRIIFELCHEQMISFEIDCQMINSTPYFTERIFLFEPQDCLFSKNGSAEQGTNNG